MRRRWSAAHSTLSIIDAAWDFLIDKAIDLPRWVVILMVFPIVLVPLSWKFCRSLTALTLNSSRSFSFQTYMPLETWPEYEEINSLCQGMAICRVSSTGSLWLGGEGRGDINTFGDMFKVQPVQDFVHRDDCGIGVECVGL